MSSRPVQAGIRATGDRGSLRLQCVLSRAAGQRFEFCRQDLLPVPQPVPRRQKGIVEAAAHGAIAAIRWLILGDGVIGGSYRASTPTNLVPHQTAKAFRGY